MRRLLTAICLSLVLVAPTLAQDATTTPTPTPLTQTVLQAFAALQTSTVPYRVTLTSETVTTLDDGTNPPAASFARVEAEGDVVGTDYTLMVDLAAGTTPYGSDAVPLITYTLTRTADTLYLYLDPANDTLVPVLEGAPGWWRYDELAALQTEVAQQGALAALGNVLLPAELQLDDNTLIAATELADDDSDPTTRTLALELDALAALFSQTDATGLDFTELFTQAAQFRQIVEAGELTWTMRVTLDADDNIIGGTFVSVQDLPFTTVEGDNFPPYDTRTEVNYRFSITPADAATVITAPADVNEP